MNQKPLRLAIVDDEPVICDLLNLYTTQWCDHNHVEAQIDIFNSAEAFSFEWETSRAYDLILLDIQMKGASGLVLAKQIRSFDQWMRIVFVTGIADYVYEGYEVSALNYLLKPVSKEKLGACLTRAYDAIKSSLQEAPEPVFVFEADGQIHRVEQRKIYAVEAQKNYSRLSTALGDFVIRMSLSDIANQLSPSLFLKTHRSFLVSVIHVRSIDFTEVILDTGERIPLSRSQRDGVQQAFIRYHKDQARTL